MNLEEWWIVKLEDKDNGPTTFITTDKEDLLGEYPEAKAFSLKDYQDEEEKADTIVEVIGSELENANYHSINGVQDKIYQSLIKRGVSKIVAAEAIFEGFEDLV